jgi:VanZ family protein
MAAVMALMTEKVQELLGYRSFEIKDLIADLSGTVAGTVAILAYIALKTEQK